VRPLPTRGLGLLVLLRIFGGPMLLVLVLLLLIGPAACMATVTDNGPTPTTTPTVVAVERVIDGDTIKVSGYGAKLETVRFIGVDTPETVHPSKPVQCWGKQASDYLKAALPRGSVVTLRFERKPDGSPDPDGLRDRTPGRRLLAYVYKRNASGETFINLRLLALGHAKAVYYPPNDDHRAVFEAAEREARTHGKDHAILGRWAHCPS
jgi:micrococcal nuclease